jgi:Sigma-70, region 4
MASLDSLPADQRAVLELVLQRGRSYDEIAQMLSIDRAGVRQRALAAFDALGPQTRVEPIRRALITDYLLGQLPQRIREETRSSLARTPPERAWARVIASELAPLARDPLPEIPAPEPAGAPDAAEPAGRDPSPEPARAGAAAPASAGASARGTRSETAAADQPRHRPPRPPRPSSRLGGAVLLGLGAVVVVAVVLVLLLTGGSSKKRTTNTGASATTTPTTTGTTTTTRPLAQVNLNPPSAGGSARGIAQIRSLNNALYVLIYATGVPANSHNAYAVWLYNSPTSSQLVGFVSPDVGSNGQLQTAGKLTANPANYKQLLVTLETQAHPKAPGHIVLVGTISIPPSAG